MAYSDFDLRKTLADFALSSTEDLDLHANVAPIEPSENLGAWLDEFAPAALGIGSERGRSEAIIFPILAEAKRRSRGPVTVAAGVTFDVDKQRGLAGVCDYLLTRGIERYYVKAPVFAAVEAKKEDIAAGLGQCAAEMVAVRVFNEREGKPLAAVHGCVTSGNLWRFLKLDGNTLFIDSREYYLSDLPKILGILVGIANG
jgi:hypothetical protein